MADIRGDMRIGMNGALRRYEPAQPHSSFVKHRLMGAREVQMGRNAAR
jgi:hypothetical protein